MLLDYDQVAHESERCDSLSCEYCRYERESSPWESIAEWRAEQERQEI